MQQMSTLVTAPPRTPKPTSRRVNWSMITAPSSSEAGSTRSEMVDAPETVRSVADERQPRWPSSAGSRAIVFGQHAVHDVLVEIDAERLRDDARNPRAAKPRVARLQFDDCSNEGLVGTFRAGLLRARLG